MESHNLWEMLVMHFHIYKYNKSHIFIHPKALPHPLATTPRDFDVYTPISVLNKKIKLQLLVIFCDSLGRENGVLSPLLKDGCSTKR